MAILALEGPDRCGKSTLFAQLKSVFDATFVAGQPHAEKLLHVMPYVEVWQESLWSCFYDPAKLYVVDRSFTVTPEVYSRLYRRPLLIDPEKWRSEQFVVYFEVPAVELQRRAVRDGDPFDPALYVECKQLYLSVLDKYSWRYADDCLAALKTRYSQFLRKDYLNEVGDWGSLPAEPCRFCHQVGGVHFRNDDSPRSLSEPQVVRCDKCGRSWEC